MVEACEEAGVHLFIVKQNRLNPTLQMLHGAVQANRFGRINMVNINVFWTRPQEYYDSGGWRGTWDLDGGGAYMNQAIHSVDLIAYLMGNVSQVTALTDTLAHKRIEVEDVGVAALRFANGALGTIEATTAVYPGFSKKVEIHGTEGTAIIEEDRLVTWDFAKGKSHDNATRRRSPPGRTT